MPVFNIIARRCKVRVRNWLPLFYYIYFSNVAEYFCYSIYDTQIDKIFYTIISIKWQTFMRIIEIKLINYFLFNRPDITWDAIFKIFKKTKKLQPIFVAFFLSFHLHEIIFFCVHCFFCYLYFLYCAFHRCSSLFFFVTCGLEPIVRSRRQ